MLHASDDEGGITGSPGPSLEVLGIHHINASWLIS